MFRESRQLPRTLCAASALALVLGAGMVGDYVDFDVDIVPSAHAAQQAGGRGEKGTGPSGDVRGGGVKKGGSEGGRGGKSMKDVLAEEDDDSDRPDWVDQWKNTEDKKGGFDNAFHMYSCSYSKGEPATDICLTPHQATAAGRR